MTLLSSLLHPLTSQTPHIESLQPGAVMPGGELELRGTHLGPIAGTAPIASIQSTPAQIVFSSEDRVLVRVNEATLSGDLTLNYPEATSNALPVRVSTILAENVHPVANPAVDNDGNIYTTLSGTRGEQTPVSIFRIDAITQQIKPFVSDILNASALAFDRNGYLYCSSRAEGTIYRISSEGAVSTFVEGMGLATGLAFDKNNNLFVGDRSGTIFKIAPDKQIFVHATLEPSMAAYHLAILQDETLLVTAPSTASYDVIHAITPDGEVGTYFRGLGRPQGLAVDVTGDVYVAASYEGRRGIVRITPQREASLAVSGPNVLGLAFIGSGMAALATRDALYQVDMQTEGKLLW